MDADVFIVVLTTLLVSGIPIYVVVLLRVILSVEKRLSDFFSLLRLYISLILYNYSSKSSSTTQQDIIQKFLNGKNVVKTGFPRPIAFVSGFEEIKEVLCSENFSDRPSVKILEILREGGIMLNNGKSWKELRKYTMKTLGQLGLLRKHQMSSILECELQNLLGHIDTSIEKSGNRIPVHDLFANPVVNVIWSIVAGETFSRNDSNYIKLKDNTYNVVNIPGIKLILFELKPFQYLVRVFPKYFGYSELFDSLKEFRDYLKAFILMRQQTGQYEAEKTSDFIDSFLKEINAHQNSEKKSIYCVDQLVALLSDLFQAGMETTSSTLESAIMFMIKYPHVQIKIQNEIDEVLGKSSPVPTSREKMPYTCACIVEINRVTNLLPFNARTAKKDCFVGGVEIKKGSYCFPYLRSVRMDETFWSDPETFRPERFLDGDQKLIQENVDRVMAFGGGVRACPGEMVGLWTIFVYLTGILQRYSLTRADDKEILGMNGYTQIVNNVIPFHFCAKRR